MNFSELALLLSLLLVFIGLETNYIPLYAFALFVFIYMNILMLFRSKLEYALSLSLFLLIVLLHTILSYFSLLDTVGFVIELLLIFMFVIVFTYYRYIFETRVLFRDYTPFVLLISTIIGLYLGVDRVLRYLLITIQDTLNSNIVLVSKNKLFYRYSISFLLFLILYFSPIIRIDLLAIFIFSIMHITRNILLLNSPKLRIDLAGHILGLDLLLKPLVLVIV